MFKNKNIRNWAIVIIVAAVAVLAVRRFSSANASEAMVSAEGEVVSLSVAETIEASGSLEAQPFAALDWKTSGVVEKVNVQPGDLVKAGDVLLTLQPSSTTASIVSAQADLINAQDELADLMISRTSLAQAEIDLKEAQEAYDKANNYLKYLNYDEYVPQTLYMAKLVQTRNGWEYKYETKNFKGPAPKEWIVDAENDLALKTAKLDDAQREYDRLLTGEDSTDVIAAKANVNAAQATVNMLSIIAPFDGEVLYVNNHAGDVVDTGGFAVNVADMDHLYVSTQVDESDIAKVKLGNQVEATLDALSGVTLTGTVTAINPVGEVVSGLVKYTVRIDLDKVTETVFMPLGTTVNVVIQVKEATASLAVPITAIQNDASGEYVWVIQSNGSPKRVDIVGGSIVGDQVAVTGNLKVGDRLQLGQTTNTNQGPRGPFGGGN
jgi:HlyD family secretion protein